MHSENDNIHIKRVDWLLIIGLTLAPMTGFRIWKIGPGEVLCLLWGIRFFNKAIKTSSYLLTFFMGFLICMMCGTLIGTIVAPDELRYADWFTWIFLTFLSLLIYSGMKENMCDYNCIFLQTFAIVSTSWYFFLYLYSLTISSFFLGTPLWYGAGARYAGGATNPHQVGTLFAVNIFILLKDILNNKKYVLNIILIIMSSFMLFETKSSTGLLAIFISFMSFLFILPIIKKMDQEKRNKLIFIEITFIILIAVVFFNLIFTTFMDFVKGDENGMGRFQLFSYVNEIFEQSPLLGLGPGMHSWENGHVQEFHNTYIEVFAASGVIGLIFFIWFSVKIIKDLSNDLMSIPIIVALYSYGLAGFTMRRLIFWGIVVMVIVVAQQKKELTEGNTIEKQQ